MCLHNTITCPFRQHYINYSRLFSVKAFSIITLLSRTHWYVTTDLQNLMALLA